jgi:AraC-like DNA-binding protein/N-acetylglutamate synthase-like GNAT family acetyltransferase
MEIQELVKYVDEHLQDDVSLVELGKLAGYSPWHIYKLFKFYTGEPFASYVRKRRLLLASRDMGNGRNLLDVALDNGFETAAGFYKAFTKQFKCSPSEYRRSQSCFHSVNASAGITEITYGNGEIEMGKVVIRKLRDGDAVSLHEYIFVRNSLEEVEGRVAKTLEQMEKGDNIYVVAVVDGNIAGTLGLARESHPLMRHRAALGDEVVNPAFDDMGIPGLLFAKAAEFAKALGVKIITGSSRAGYFTERFFAENNFAEIGRIPGGFEESWNNDETYDEVLYYCAI